ncbi:MAG: Rrf2 family transcriptional regulator [Crocinitomicaceae bacterium]|nr:Rrf2 family transcriptional regulator [Crocinitomicaceae bacterium]MBK8924636.1 Rrf2 family transcriptional regulator [Crocinitomicaceae bacterium]
MFSKTCEYGIKAAIFIAVKSGKGERTSLQDIAHEIDSPASFTAKILQKMVHSKIIASVKGPHGGFEITPVQASRVRLAEIVSSIDGDSIYTGCGLGLRNCNEKKPCPVHHRFKQIRDDLRTMLESTTLFDLSADVTNGLAFLKRK